ncbi:MAG: nuclear transport factor 2 family protein [Nocardioidaceae bacterium]|nr:MAG: nuclear transport factor 2 family protein [Nocardioidaceae bacterium]
MSNSEESEIKDVIFKYAWALDTRDWAALAEVFTPDARGEFSDPGYGDQDMGTILRLFQEGAETGPIRQWQHFVTNQLITHREGDRARIKAFFTCAWRFDDHQQQPRNEVAMVGGIYENDLLRTVNGWRIAVLRATTWWDHGGKEVMPEWRYLGRGPLFG